MYPISIQLFKRLLPYVAVVGELIIQLVSELTSVGSGLIFASVLILVYLAFYAHAALLRAEGPVSVSS